jgi:hypothetical protein
MITIGNLGSFLNFVDCTREEAYQHIANHFNTTTAFVAKAIEDGHFSYREFTFENAFYSYDTASLEDSGFPLDPPFNFYPNFKHLTQRESGLWYFEGRKLEVFGNVFYFKNFPPPISKQEWCEMYGLTQEAFGEALYLVEIFKKDYEEWVQKNSEEDSQNPEID